MGELSKSAQIIEWIETYCKVPEGKDVGKPLRLRDWQKDVIRQIYDNPAGTRRAIISVGRKNAKTTLSALLLLVHLVGPMVLPNSQLYSTAMSRDQAAVLFSLAASIIRQSAELGEMIAIRDTAKQLFCDYYQTIYRALSADSTTAYGLSPVFCVHDELGQVKGPRHGLYEAIETATGAHEDPLSIVISTQAPTDADLLSVLIDDAVEGNDPRVVVVLHTAPEDADPFDIETIRMANPALGDFLNEREVVDMAEAARRMPSREAEFRNLILNQRVEASSPFVTQSVWKANGGDPCFGQAWYGGLDLSETSDLTSLELVSQSADGTWGVESWFWLPEHGLEDRARKDRVPYDVWRDEGFLHVTPGRSVEYEFVAKEIANLFEIRDIRKIAFDRYNMRHLRPWLIHAGLSETLIDDRFVDFGQGYFSMSPALRNFESLLLAEKLRHGNHPILTMCAANAVVKTDEAGNRKLDKKRSRGRIDGMVALAMATEVANANASDTGEKAFAGVEVNHWTDQPKGNRYILVYAANEKKQSPDTSVILVLDLGPDKTYRVLEIVRDKLNLSERTDLLFEFHRKYDPLKVAYDKRGHEGDIGHIQDRQSRENYRFRVEALDTKLSEDERIMRLVPLFESGRVIFPEKHERDGIDMLSVFVEQELAGYPYSAHTDILDLFSRVLDCRMIFPNEQKLSRPVHVPSQW